MHPSRSPVLPPCLAWPVDVGVYDPHVSGQGVISRKRFLFGAQVAAHFLFPGIVDRVFVTGEIVGTGKDRVAGLAGAGIDALTFMWASLRIA